MKFPVGTRVLAFVDGLGNLEGTIISIKPDMSGLKMHYDVLIDGDSGDFPFSEDELAFLETPDQIFKDLLK